MLERHLYCEGNALVWGLMLVTCKSGNPWKAATAPESLHTSINPHVGNACKYAMTSALLVSEGNFG